MFLNRYKLHNLKDYANSLLENVNFSGTEEKVIYDPEVAEGGSLFISISNSISLQVANYIAKTDMVFERQPATECDILISFQNFTFSQCFCSKDCDEIIANNNNIGSVQCKGTQVAEKIKVPPGVHVKVILVLLKQGWLDELLADENLKRYFEKYTNIPALNYRKEFLSILQRGLFEEIMTTGLTRKLNILFIKSRVLTLLESFFNDILEKDAQDDERKAFYSTKKDIEKLQLSITLIESHLQTFFPGIEVLAKNACMSRTKFICLFYEVYGMSAFEYYQKKRMNIAYEYLATQHLQIAEVASKIGYCSSSSFIQAFKKQYGFLPKEVFAKS